MGSGGVVAHQHLQYEQKLQKRLLGILIENVLVRAARTLLVQARVWLACDLS